MDIELIETGNGGDLVKKAKDFSIIYGFENMIYIALFGGNLNQSTPIKRLAREQAFDFWGNYALMANDASIQFNSETERTLNNVALTSSGRLLIDSAIKKDLEFMKEFATVKVITSIIGVDKILISIRVKQPDNIEAKDYIYLWDATRQELFDRESIVSGGGVAPPDILRIFSGEFDMTFA